MPLPRIISNFSGIEILHNIHMFILVTTPSLVLSIVVTTLQFETSRLLHYGQFNALWNHNISQKKVPFACMLSSNIIITLFEDNLQLQASFLDLVGPLGRVLQILEH